MKKKQTKTERLREATRKHEKWLRAMGAHKDQRTKKPVFTIEKSTWEQDNSYKEEESNTSEGTHKHTKWDAGTKKQVMRYSGKRRLLGIATLHKSNLVPVFEKEELQSIGKMRR